MLGEVGDLLAGAAEHAIAGLVADLGPGRPALPPVSATRAPPGNARQPVDEMHSPVDEMQPPAAAAPATTPATPATIPATPAVPAARRRRR